VKNPEAVLTEWALDEIAFDGGGQKTRWSRDQLALLAHAIKANDPDHIVEVDPNNTPFNSLGWTDELHCPGCAEPASFNPLALDECVYIPLRKNHASDTTTTRYRNGISRKHDVVGLAARGAVNWGYAQNLWTIWQATPEKIGRVDARWLASFGTLEDAVIDAANAR
jgi:hypothetical protein